MTPAIKTHDGHFCTIVGDRDHRRQFKAIGLPESRPEKFRNAAGISIAGHAASSNQATYPCSRVDQPQ